MTVLLLAAAFLIWAELGLEPRTSDSQPNEEGRVTTSAAGGGELGKQWDAEKAGNRGVITPLPPASFCPALPCPAAFCLS